MTESVTRRRMLMGGAAVAGVTIGAAASWPFWPDRVKNVLVGPPEVYIPDAEVGQVTLESVYSESRGMDVDLFTAVPAGYGSGKGLPVVVVCHGATATPADYEPFGLPQFLTAAVDAGAEPFVLAGAYGSALAWEPQPNGDDPQAMVLTEMPRWLHERDFDASRCALWGWSMGGRGVLRMAEVDPGWARVVAAFAPAISEGDDVFTDADALVGTPLGFWVGTDDSFYEPVQKFVAILPEEPELNSSGPGGHTRIYWNDQTIEAFTFLGSHLGRASVN
ncbi:MAG: esterase [Actinomycetia bacterium]|nr:esterase [Actinomycetes bacterium]